MRNESSLLERERFAFESWFTSLPLHFCGVSRGLIGGTLIGEDIRWILRRSVSIKWYSEPSSLDRQEMSVFFISLMFFLHLFDFVLFCFHLSLILHAYALYFPDNVIVDAIKLLLLNYSNFSIAKIIVKEIERVKLILSRLPTNT